MPGHVSRLRVKLVATIGFGEAFAVLVQVVSMLGPFNIDVACVN